FQLLGTGRASSSLPEVVIGAAHGRIDVLFVVTDTQIYGKVDLELNKVDVYTEVLADSQELGNEAAINTIANGGMIVARPLELMPNKAQLAAIFRF
ncbi:MAG: hypothetical protein Q8N36_05770, partial [bacterium]|nr:hypothetical protein [bacterium]